MATASSPTADMQAPVNHFGRLFGALFSPKATFEDVARRPTWILPIVLLCVFGVVITTIFGQRVGWERFMENQFSKNPRIAQMPPDQRQQGLERAVKSAPYFGYFFGTVTYFALALLIAGVLMGAFNLLASAGVRYKAALGIVSHAMVPWALGGLLGIVVLLVKDPDAIDLENLVASNLGAFVPGEAARWLAALAKAFDVFVFWMIFLLAVGFTAANPKKVTTGKALGIVLVLWAVFTLLRVGWAAAFS